MDAKNVPKYGVKLQKVFPSQVTAIQLDSQASELPIRVDVTLAYMYLENFDYQVKIIVKGNFNVNKIIHFFYLPVQNTFETRIIQSLFSDGNIPD